MRAMVLHEWGGPLLLEDRPTPLPGPGEIQLRVGACGVGDTLNNMRGGRNASMPGAAVPRVIGHEVAGLVTEVGADVRSVRAGQRVAVYMYLTCGACVACRGGHDPMCRSLRGMVGLAIDGGLAEYMVVPAANAVPLPDDVSELDACVAVDAIATPWHALRGALRTDPSDTLVVIGAGGGVGVHAVKVGRLLGARVIAVDITEDKRSFALDHGAEAAIDGRGAVTGAIMELTDGAGADVVIDYVASEVTLLAGFAALAYEGTLIVQGVNPPGEEFHVEPRRFVHRQLTVRGSRYASRREVAEALDLVATGQITPAVTATVPLERTEELFGRIERRELLGRAAVLMEATPGRSRVPAPRPAS